MKNFFLVFFHLYEEVRHKSNGFQTQKKNYLIVTPCCMCVKMDSIRSGPLDPLCWTISVHQLPKNLSSQTPFRFRAHSLHAWPPRAVVHCHQTQHGVPHVLRLSVGQDRATSWAESETITSKNSYKKSLKTTVKWESDGSCGSGDS